MKQRTYTYRNIIAYITNGWSDFSGKSKHDQNYFKDIFTSYLQMGFSIVIPLLLIPYVVNKLGQELYGIWVLLTSMVAYFNLSNLGFSTTLLKDVSFYKSNSEKVNKIINTTFFFFVFVVALVTVIFVLIELNFRHLFKLSTDYVEIAKQTFFIIYFVFVFNFFSMLFDNTIFAYNKMYLKNILLTAKILFIGISTFLVLYFGYSIFEIALMNLFITILIFLIMFYFAKKLSLCKIRWRYFDLDIFKQMISPSFHYFIIGVAVIIIFYSDNLVISAFIGVAAVSSYSIAYKAVDMTEKVIFKIVDVILPKISQLNSNKEFDKILFLHNKILIISMLIALPVYSILFFWGTDLLCLWVGAENVVMPVIMKIFVIFAFVHTWVHVSAIFVTALGIHKETSYMALFEAILNIILSIIFLHYYGLLGVAMGTIISHLLTNAWFVSYWFYRNLYNNLGYTRSFCLNSRR